MQVAYVAHSPRSCCNMFQGFTGHQRDARSREPSIYVDTVLSKVQVTIVG